LQKLISKSYIASLLVLSIASTNSCYAETEFQEIKEAVQKVIEKHALEKQEFKPIIYTNLERNSDSRSNLKKESNSKIKEVSFKNEFFQSVKISLSSDNDFKIIYLNPYEKLDNIVINKEEDYKIKVFDLDEKYLGNLIRTDLKKMSLVRVSPFLIFPELLSKEDSSLIQKDTNFTQEKVELEPIKSELLTKEIVKPKEIEIQKKINPLKPEPLEKITENKVDNQFKIANISDYKVKISIKKADGESIGTNWTIDNDVYSPEALKFASQAVVLDPDTRISITYLDKDNKIKKELSLTAKDIPKDSHDNYTYFIENIVSE
jgi:phosphopantetheinyl transferase (holo-ACP synthase)